MSKCCSNTNLLITYVILGSILYTNAMFLFIVVMFVMCHWIYWGYLLHQHQGNYFMWQPSRTKVLILGRMNSLFYVVSVCFKNVWHILLFLVFTTLWTRTFFTAFGFSTANIIDLCSLQFVLTATGTQVEQVIDSQKSSWRIRRLQKLPVFYAANKLA